MLNSMAGETWNGDLTDWQRASFSVQENSPPSKLDALRMKLSQLEVECLKNSSKGILPAGASMLTEHLKEYRKCLMQSPAASSSGVSQHANMKEWSSGLKLEDVLQMNVVKRYKDIAEMDNRKFKSQVTCNFNSIITDSSYKRPGATPKHQPVFSSSKSQWISRPQRKRHRSSADDDDSDITDTTVQAKKDSSLEFVTAKDQYIINQHKKGCGHQYDQTSTRHTFTSCDYGGTKKSLGARRNVGNRFIPPIKGDEDDGRMGAMRAGMSGGNGAGSAGSRLPPELEGDERLKNIEPRMVEMIMNEIMDHGAPVQWDDIAGLQFAKNTIKEIVIFPMLRPDIFTGLRGPPKGILLFGPPGTGKTLIGKCIASQAGATFFSISASSLTSKWIGEGEKMVRALFAVALCYEPAVIFIDEIDSLLSQRSDSEHEASRRMKTEFLIKLDGVTATNSERILLVGATNRPQEIDEAARRRLVKRLYIPLPDASARRQIVTNLMQQQVHSLTDEEFDKISQQTDGHSGADVANLCSEAAMGPIRDISLDEIQNIPSDKVRPVRYEDFVEALKVVRPSVSSKDLQVYEDWNKLYGCGR